MSAPDFTVDVFQNEYLPDRAREVNAIVTVSSAGSAADGPASAASAAEIIIIDCSASMGAPMAKMDQAREATGAVTLGDLARSAADADDFTRSADV